MGHLGSVRNRWQLAPIVKRISYQIPPVEAAHYRHADPNQTRSGEAAGDRFNRQVLLGSQGDRVVTSIRWPSLIYRFVYTEGGL